MVDFWRLSWRVISAGASSPEQEKRVCRYSAFFYEDRVWDAKCPIGTPTIERVVVRHLVISYYLVDLWALWIQSIDPHLLLGPP